MKKFYRKSSRRPRSRKAVVRKALRKNTNSRISKVVKRVLSRQLEVKSKQYVNTASPKNFLSPSADFVGNNVFSITPTIGSIEILQGDGASERTGNQIRTKSAKMRIVLYPKKYVTGVNEQPSPTIVTFWCVTPKQGYLNPASMADAFDTSMWQLNNTSTGYQSQLYDMTIPLNKDLFTVHFKRSYKLGHATMYGSPNAGVGEGLNQAQWANNDYKLNHVINFDFTRFLPKNIKFNDTTAAAASKTVYLICGIARADGSIFSNASQLPVDMWYTMDYRYTDA